MARPPKFRRTKHIGMSDAAKAARRSTIGGSDAKIIMSGDQHAITQLWLEKRGEAEHDDLSEVVLIQLGNVTEPLNFDLFENATGLWCTDEQTKVVSEDYPFMHATLDGYVREEEFSDPIGIMDGKFMLPFNDWSIESALEKHWAQLQHNMLVTETDLAWLSVIKATGGYAIIKCEADPFYQNALLRAEMEFHRCLVTGDPPNAVHVNNTAPKPEPIEIVDMSTHNLWTTLATKIVESTEAAEIHAHAKTRLKELFPDHAAIAHGHGVKLKRSKDGKTLFEIEVSKDAKKAAKEAIDGPPEAKPRRSRAKTSEPIQFAEAA